MALFKGMVLVLRAASVIVKRAGQAKAESRAENRLPVKVLILAMVIPLSACGAQRQNSERAQQSELRVQLAQAYLEQGRVAVALREAQLALEYGPRDPGAHQVMGLIQQRLGEQEAALDFMRRAFELDSDNPIFNTQYATLLCRERQYDEALELFERVNDNPLNEIPAATHARSGGCRLRAGDLEGAERDLLRAQALQPEIPAVLYSMALVERLRDRFTEAHGWLARYFAVAPDTPDSLGLGVEIGRALGKQELAEEYLRRLRAKWPNSAQLRDPS